MRLIDADALYMLFLEMHKQGNTCDPQDVIKAINNAPTIEAASGEAVDKKDTTLEEWLITNMPAGTIIGDPKWWAERIKRVVAFTIQKEIKFTDCEFGKSVGMPEYTCVKQCQYADTSPQPRDWVGLSDEDIEKLNDVFGYFKYGDAQGAKSVAFSKAIEAKLKELNHG